MLKIAVVDDDITFQNQIIEYITKFFDNQVNRFHVSRFNNGVDFLTEYKGDFDLVILDIEMPMMNGMDVAGKLRELDSEVKLIFITQTARLAIRGYEVSALDYILKPLDYENDFKNKFANVLKKIDKNKDRGHDILANDASGMVVRISLNDLFFVKKDKDNALFYTVNGVFYKRMSLLKVEEALQLDSVATCNSGCLVNLAYIKNIKDNTVCLTNDEIIPISRGKKKEFLKKFFKYINN